VSCQMSLIVKAGLHRRLRDRERRVEELLCSMNANLALIRVGRQTDHLSEQAAQVVGTETNGRSQGYEGHLLGGVFLQVLARLSDRFRLASNTSRRRESP
jgi:hypothetical protein